ncbi:unnamed protein product [Trichogramma brassicae]|uniref:Major facilitator superfamily (MFS) profile domain-containing protein n=1 Tax=Trichogramma brassicae TaxID=86971 RepID=A0A6H5I1Y2_9HYME|nr:unnamed protein product [Trichogramma brassicae]
MQNELIFSLKIKISIIKSCQLVASYAYGNVVGNFLGGMAAIRFGPRASIFWSSLISVVVSLISPILINIHWSLLVVGRIIIGLTGGMTFPACHALVARWAPPAEKGLFMWTLLGGTFGTIIAYPMIGAIAENLSWEWGWYIPSFLLLIWCFVWRVLAYDSPLEHPGISDEEKTYIVASQAGTVQTIKPSLKETPMMDIFTSVPFIALVICHFGNLFLLYFYSFSLILYMTNSLGMSISKGGAATAVPWFLRMLFGFFFCWFGDLNKKKQFLSTTAFRKLATIFSHLIPGLFLIAVGYVGSSMNMYGLVAMLSLALGFNGAASISNLSNNQDLSPNYAGFLYGIMNTIGGLSGIIGPPMVEAIVSKEVFSFLLQQSTDFLRSKEDVKLKHEAIQEVLKQMNAVRILTDSIEKNRDKKSSSNSIDAIVVLYSITFVLILSKVVLHVTFCLYQGSWDFDDFGDHMLDLLMHGMTMHYITTVGVCHAAFKAINRSLLSLLKRFNLLFSRKIVLSKEKPSLIYNIMDQQRPREISIYRNYNNARFNEQVTKLKTYYAVVVKLARNLSSLYQTVLFLCVFRYFITIISSSYTLAEIVVCKSCPLTPILDICKHLFNIIFHLVSLVMLTGLATVTLNEVTPT